ncbi:N-chimaerin-like [Tropilaelaps mercedesae]|uniref:N-chimaerin-like n=1 Tax=Tropilaelaps mercedesae TaxID=418985 RepID=A0A1V9XEE6_9ACAR|nr:N-chimaerin-like [Tropilaelaps mercedesae]
MQQKAPPPKRIICNKDLPARPHHYGKEYHGKMERDEAARVVRAEGEGAYLVRESSREPGQYSLVFLFDGQPKNYRLYYTDNQHYVGSKRFNTLQGVAISSSHLFVLSESKKANLL